MAQQTLRRAIALVGTGLHSGRPARLAISPAFAGHGIWFRRTDVSDRDNLISASWDNVVDTRLNTRLANADGVSVSTVEHLMAALAGTGIHNALVEIDGPEVPIFDGSALRFVQEIMAAGIQPQDQPILELQILKPVRVERGDAFAELLPADHFCMDVQIEFDQAAIGRQALEGDFSNGAFLRELADCRTFCKKSDVDAMRANGLALGGTMDNAIVIDGDTVLSPGGFRRADECVRHKMLDAVGDLALAGAPIVGKYRGFKLGHALTNDLLRKLFATPGAMRLVPAEGAISERLPGIGITRHDLAVSA